MQAIKYKILVFSLSALRLFAGQLEIDVGAKSAILMNAETGKVLFEKNARELAYPGSTTKIATAIYLLEKNTLDFDSSFTPSMDCLLQVPLNSLNKNPAYRLEPDGTKMGIRQGETLPVRALFHGMMLCSGNDAANALAEASSGSIPSFMDELNAYLRKIGCLNTHFSNPHGLHYPEHVTTAYDLAVLMQRAIKHPELIKLFQAKSFSCPKTNKQPAREILQFNRLVKKGKFHYPHIIGGKTGYHAKALYTLVAAAEKHNRPLIAVVLGCETRDSRYVDVIKMFETAFAESKERILVVKAGQFYEREIQGAEAPILAFLQEDIYYENYPSETPVFKAFVHWGEVRLPVIKGSKVGEVRVLDEEGELICQAPLFAKDGVKKTFLRTVKDFFSSLIP